MSIKHLLPLLAALIIGTIAGRGNATVLTFDGVIGLIPDAYGDRVTSTTDGMGFMYGEGDGFTPNVVVEYNPTSTPTTFSSFLSGYSDLTRSLGHSSFSVEGEVILRPDPGYTVVLNSLDVGSWQGDRVGQLVILDGNDTVLFDSGSTLFPFASGTFFDFGGPLTSRDVIRIQLFDWGDLSVDNVNFSQINNVPTIHPTLLHTLLPGLMIGAGLVAMRRRVKEI